MEDLELTQMVPIEKGSEKTVEQSINYDPSDDWMSLVHDGNSIVLTVENYRKLVDLAEKVLNLKS